MDRWIKRYLAPSLLVVVAAGQLITVHTGELSRWEGGGFGMYSELPPSTRHVVIDSGEAPSPRGAPELEEVIDRFQAIPSERNLEAIAETLRKSGIMSFQIEAWAERFDLDTMEVTAEHIGGRSTSEDSP